jgi:hypothetical protein
VYRRFGTVSFAISFSVHQNIIKILMYVETGQGQYVQSQCSYSPHRRHGAIGACRG